MSVHDGFFAVDRRAWARVCQLGMNVAVAYLVLARGSGGDNRTTAWSVNAIETYTGIGRPRAQKAVTALKQSGLIRHDQGGSRPMYFILPAQEVLGCEGGPPLLNSEEQRILALIGPENVRVPKVGRSDNQWQGGNPYAVALALARKSVVLHVGGQHFRRADPAELRPDPDWIWLPNTILDGAAGEVPPVELVRQSHNVAALRLFVDLYHSHGLAADGGIHWRRMRRSVTRHRLGQRGPFTVWGFQEDSLCVWPDAPFVNPYLGEQMEVGEGFWTAIHTLYGLGVLEFVGHVIEADSSEAEIIHPYAVGDGEPDEQRLAVAAHSAAQAMLTEGQIDWAVENSLRLVPIATHHLPNVQMVGIPRLRYRPRTEATAAWFIKQKEWAKFIERYQELEQTHRGTGAGQGRHATSR
jgi:hypothetical protein